MLFRAKQREPALRRKAERIVDERWCEIQALAAELLLWRRLDAQQIAAAIARASLGPGARRRRAWDEVATRAAGRALAPQGL